MLDPVQRRIIAHALRHPEFFFNQVNIFYNFSDVQLSKFGSILNWSLLSRNMQLTSNEEFIEKYRDRVDWAYISCNAAIPWSERLIEKYQDLLYWSFKDIPQANNYFHSSFSQNYGVPWTPELIDKFSTRLNIDELINTGAGFWTEELLELFRTRINWKEFPGELAGPVSIEFIERINKENDPPYYLLGICDNLELINKYKDLICWTHVTLSRKLPWSLGLLESFKDKLVYQCLAGNEEALKGIHCYEFYLKNAGADYFSFGLSMNEGLPWTEDFFRKNKSLWNTIALAKNVGLPWSIEFIEKYFAIPEYFHDLWEYGYFWSNLHKNHGLPWSMDLLEKYEEKWILEDLTNNDTLWEKAYKNNVNEEVVDTFFRLIT